MPCVFATTERHCNQNSTRRMSRQPTCYFSALRKAPFHMANCFALRCGPLRSPGSHFRFIHPWFKALKNWHVWFLANHREKKVPTSSISLENTMPKISLWQQQHCSFPYFSLAQKRCHVAEFRKLRAPVLILAVFISLLGHSQMLPRWGDPSLAL